MSPLSYPHNRLASRIAISSLNLIFHVAEKCEVNMSNPSTVMGFTLLSMTKERLESESVEREIVASNFNPECFGSEELGRVVRKFEANVKTERILLGQNKFWGRGRNWVLDLAPLVDVFEDQNPNRFDDMVGFDEAKGFDEKWIVPTCVNWRREELGLWVAGVVERCMGRCSQRYTKVENKPLDIRIQVWFLRRKDGKGCPFTLGREKVFLVVGLESLSSGGRGVWSCWGGEKVKVGCWSWGWGGDVIEKGVESESGNGRRGRSRRRKGEQKWDVERGDEDFKPLLL